MFNKIIADATEFYGDLKNPKGGIRSETYWNFDRAPLEGFLDELGYSFQEVSDENDDRSIMYALFDKTSLGSKQDRGLCLFSFVKPYLSAKGGSVNRIKEASAFTDFVFVSADILQLHVEANEDYFSFDSPVLVENILFSDAKTFVS